MHKPRKNSGAVAGFTLVELLVVISILGVLATIGLTAFTSSQGRGRDAQRKSDLKQIASSLELYYSDYGKYPDASAGKIAGCPSTTQTACAWGTGEFWDTKTVYFKALPKDPVANGAYYYRVVDSGTNQKFQLFTHLENSQDPNCISDQTGKPNCTSPAGVPAGVSCGSNICNFSITSPNTTPSE